MALLAVGSIAFDDIKTPYGQERNILGGSATYFAVSASFFAPVRLVAVVGDDFDEEHLRVFTDRGIDVTGLQRAPGRTFRWSGEYDGDMNVARTLDTQLNVFEHFSPKIPPSYADSEFVFLGNIDPPLQLHVRKQMARTRLGACDTMNYWIQRKPAELRQTLAHVDALLINEGEARMLSGTENLRRAAAIIRAMGPRVLVIKRGEHGVCLFKDRAIFFAPAYPLEQVHDPTGAGDTFAGGFMGHLARCGDLSDCSLFRAMVYGSVMASFAVEEFGLRRLLRLRPEEIEERFREFRHMTHFDV